MILGAFRTIAFEHSTEETEALSAPFLHSAGLTPFPHMQLNADQALLLVSPQPVLA